MTTRSLSSLLVSLDPCDVLSCTSYFHSEISLRIPALAVLTVLLETCRLSPRRSSLCDRAVAFPNLHHSWTSVWCLCLWYVQPCSCTSPFRRGCYWFCVLSCTIQYHFRTWPFHSKRLQPWYETGLYCSVIRVHSAGHLCTFCIFTRPGLYVKIGSLTLGPEVRIQPLFYHSTYYKQKAIEIQRELVQHCFYWSVIVVNLAGHLSTFCIGNEDWSVC